MPNQKWEHCVETVSGKEEDAEVYPLLDKMGRKGWEAWHMRPISGGLHLEVFFKRPV